MNSSSFLKRMIKKVFLKQVDQEEHIMVVKRSFHTHPFQE